MPETVERLIDRLSAEHHLTVTEYQTLIDARTPETAAAMAQAAVRVRKGIYGDEVFTRGLIEISNICPNNCLYCEIRRDNLQVRRYRLSEEEILSCAREGYSLGFEAFYWRESVSPVQVLRYSFTEVRYWIENTLTSLTMMLRGQLGLDNVSGPVGVVSMVDTVVEESSEDGGLYVFLNLLNLTILLTANLGVINLLPIPAMDGGRLVFILIEAIIGRPVPRKAEGIIHAVGILLLFGLMIVVLFKDIFALF